MAHSLDGTWDKLWGGLLSGDGAGECFSNVQLEFANRVFKSNLQPSDCSVCSLPVEVADELMGFVLCRVLIMFSNYWGVCVGEIASMMCGTVVSS